MSASEAMFADERWVYAVVGPALYIGRMAPTPAQAPPPDGFDDNGPQYRLVWNCETTLSPCYIRTFALIPTTSGQLTTISAFQPAHVAHGITHGLPIVLNVPVRPVASLDVLDQRAIASEIERADMMSQAARSGVVLAGK